MLQSLPDPTSDDRCFGVRLPMPPSHQNEYCTRKDQNLSSGASVPRADIVAAARRARNAWTFLHPSVNFLSPLRSRVVWRSPRDSLGKTSNASLSENSTGRQPRFQSTPARKISVKNYMSAKIRRWLHRPVRRFANLKTDATCSTEAMLKGLRRRWLP